MALELGVALNAAKDMTKINLTFARPQMILVLSVTVGESHFFAASQAHAIDKAVNAFWYQGSVIDREGPTQVGRIKCGSYRQSQTETSGNNASQSLKRTVLIKITKAPGRELFHFMINYLMFKV